MMEMMAQQDIHWQIRVPIFRHSVILKQLGIAIGIPFGIVALVIGFASGEKIYALYGLGLIAALLLLTWLFIMSVYRGTYDVEFTLDDSGALCRTQTGQAKKNRLINGLTVFLGLLSASPSAAGTGLLAQSRQETFLRWSRLTDVTYHPRNHTIVLRGATLENMVLFCTPENYPLVERRVKARSARLRRNS